MKCYRHKIKTPYNFPTITIRFNSGITDVKCSIPILNIASAPGNSGEIKILEINPNK